MSDMSVLWTVIFGLLLVIVAMAIIWFDQYGRWQDERRNLKSTIFTLVGETSRANRKKNQ